jgi:hypothetical protein
MASASEFVCACPRVVHLIEKTFDLRLNTCQYTDCIFIAWPVNYSLLFYGINTIAVMHVLVETGCLFCSLWRVIDVAVLRFFLLIFFIDVFCVQSLL